MNSTLRTILIFLFMFLAMQVHANAPKHFIIGGYLVTPTSELNHAWLEISNGTIAHIYLKKPETKTNVIIDTDDFIFPGLIDLHNHPQYNIFPHWRPQTKFANRYLWRQSSLFDKRIGKAAEHLLKNKNNFCDIAEYAAIKALIGGTTAMIGMTDNSSPIPQTIATVPDCAKHLIRFLDLYTGFYNDHERIVNSIGIRPFDMNNTQYKKILSGIKNNSIDLLAIHIAEGSPADLGSRAELNKLDSIHLLGIHTTLIHSVGLTTKQFLRVHHAGASIIWSPRSNFELYGNTANIKAIYDQGISIAIAPDWSITGSDNMLDEINYANQINQTKLNGLFSAKQLVEMATIIPARIAKLNHKIGTLTQGSYADFFLLKKHQANAYKALVNAKNKDIELVFVNGVPLYGNINKMQQMKAEVETITVCNQKRALNSEAFPYHFADVKQRLTSQMKKQNKSLAKLAECD